MYKHENAMFYVIQKKILDVKEKQKYFQPFYAKNEQNNFIFLILSVLGNTNDV